MYSKARLATLLDPAERRDLTLKMLSHVLDALTELNGRVIVIGSDNEVRKVSQNRGSLFELDQTNSLNGAISQAISRCIAERFDSVLVVAADLPFLSTHELKKMIDSIGAESIVICPSKDCGTNALFLRPPRSMPMRFGPRSLVRHLKEAMRSGRKFKLYWSPGLAFDLDRVADFRILGKTKLSAGGFSSFMQSSRVPRSHRRSFSSSPGPLRSR